MPSAAEISLDGADAVLILTGGNPAPRGDAMSESATPDVTTKPREKEAVKTRRVPPYNVILENDDHHSFDFVIEVLRKALGYTEQKAVLLTQEAHNSGRAIVWTGPREVAE